MIGSLVNVTLPFLFLVFHGGGHHPPWSDSSAVGCGGGVGVGRCVGMGWVGSALGVCVGIWDGKPKLLLSTSFRQNSRVHK